MSKTLILKPHLSEKTYAQSEGRVYVFKVPADANKHAVARAVAEQFDVQVVDVNMVNIPGKVKRTLSLSGKRVGRVPGQRPDLKKAYVRLAEGSSLPFFAAVEEAEAKQEETQEKLAKAAEKQSKKSDKEKTEKITKPARGLRRNKNQVEDEK